MQAQMERARCSLAELRRFWWSGNTCKLFQEEKIIGKSNLEQIMLNWDSRIWQACVLGIWCAMPINDARPYCFLLSKTPSVRKWLLCAENDSNQQTHIHLLALTAQRSDSFKRTLERLWPTLALSAMSDIEEPDPTLEIIKCQKCHKPSSLVAYMTKDPLWIAANDEETLTIFQSVYAHDLGERFRAKQEIERLKKADPSTANMHAITAEITDVILNHNCKSVEDCMRAAPEIIAKHLHRAGLATIIQNCIAWVTSTGGGWSLPTIAAKYPSHPEYIHIILLHQGITPHSFDPIFYHWITKQNLKKNTLVLWGPSNTGKSAFISGLKMCLNWGEIVNSNTFAFEGLINTQMGIWEEPLISPELAEKAKQIFEGMETSIPVKYRKPTKLTRIPIIITTNHPPWRFCTKEEEMFRNRMHIFNWTHNMHNTHFICRASEHSCQCRVCQTSRNSEDAASGGTTSSLSGEEQSIQQLVSPAGSSELLPARSMSVFGEETPIFTTQTSGSFHEQSAGHTTGSQIERTDSAGPSSGAGTTTEHSIRSSRQHGSGHSPDRIPCTQSGGSECMVAHIPGGSDGNISPRVRSDTSGTDTDTADTDNNSARRHRRKRKDSHKMVVLGTQQTQETRAKIPTPEPGLDWSVGTLTIPTRIQWLMYLSYLQTRYG
uniref:Nonstructural protein 1 n=1 Tax=Hamaparvovirinae sp. TaxID=2809447 RepID=A0AAU7P191_9VIRU